MKLFLAVDAGGTKTDYVLADETRELARVRSGTIKRMRTDAATAAANLDGALKELFLRSGFSMREVTRTCIGAAGNSVPLVVDWLRESFAAKVGGELLILGDVEIALNAAFPGEGGVLVLAGTGSNIAGRTRSGVFTYAGGWGPVLGDQGSGYRIGLNGLRSVFLAEDEGRKTSLLLAILEFWKLDSLNALVEFGNRLPSPDFSKLTELVVRCAEQGDEVATAVLQREAEELAYLVRLVMRRLQLSSDTAGFVPPVAFAGSIMEKVYAVRQGLISAVRKEFPNVQAMDGVVDPVAGALWRARTGG